MGNVCSRGSEKCSKENTFLKERENGMGFGNINNKHRQAFWGRGWGKK